MLFLSRLYQEYAQAECYDVKGAGNNQNVLIAGWIYLDTVELYELAGFLNDCVGHLVAGKTCKCPSRKCNSVDCRNASHSVVVRKQGRDVREAAAVACIYNENQGKNENCKKNVFGSVFNSLRKVNDCCESDGKNENQLVN